MDSGMDPASDSAMDRNVDVGTPPTDDAAAPNPDVGATPESSCDAAVPGDRSAQLEVAGLARSYHVHVPPHATDAPLPLVFNFHGWMQTYDAHRTQSMLNETADRAGFITVHPEGIDVSWNAGNCCGGAQSRGVDDLDEHQARVVAVPARLRGLVLDANVDLGAPGVDRVLDQLAQERPRIGELMHQGLERVADVDRIVAHESAMIARYKRPREALHQ